MGRRPVPQRDGTAAAHHPLSGRGRAPASAARNPEPRAEITGFYQRVWQHTDATISALAIDAPGYVPWWDDHVKLFNIMVHMLNDTARHAGHADILREQLDGTIGMSAKSTALHGRDSAFWEARRATIEQAARAADPASVPPQPR